MVGALRCWREPHLAAAIDAVGSPFEPKRDGFVVRNDPTTGVLEVTHVEPTQTITEVAESTSGAVRSQQQSRYLDAACRQHKHSGSDGVEAPALINEFR